MTITTRHGRVLPADAAQAVGRFRPEGPLGYRAKSVPDAEVRATREEALADEIAHWEAIDDAGPVPHTREDWTTMQVPPFKSAPMRVLTKFKHNDLSGPRIVASANGRQHTTAYDHAAGPEGSHRAAVEAMLRHLDADPEQYVIVHTDETSLGGWVWHVWHKDAE